MSPLSLKEANCDCPLHGRANFAMWYCPGANRRLALHFGLVSAFLCRTPAAEMTPTAALNGSGLVSVQRAQTAAMEAEIVPVGAHARKKKGRGRRRHVSGGGTLRDDRFGQHSRVAYLCCSQPPIGRAASEEGRHKKAWQVIPVAICERLPIGRGRRFPCVIGWCHSEHPPGFLSGTGG